jgi:UDP-N-acetylmuramoylalanine--D-glutamate ligase
VVIDLVFMREKDVAVLGLGRTGLATARALAAAGANVAAWDDRLAARRAAKGAGIDIAAPNTAAWKRSATLVLSPGIPHTYPRPHPAVAAARDQGMAVIGDVELFARAKGNASCIAVTGTNGKSTTTALIGHIFAQAGRSVSLGGNLGRAVLDFDPLGPDGTYVVELSSYQLELTKTASFDIAALINISADHLDRHGGMSGYVAAKRRIFDNQTPRMAVVIGIDDAPCRRIHLGLVRGGHQHIIPISACGVAAGGVYVIKGILYDDIGGKARPVLDVAEISTLPGDHNWQNTAAAYAGARAAGLRPSVIARAIRSYPGLPHRQERVAVIDGIGYVNDSKATNADSARRALACYGNIYWIAGGRAKEAELHLPRRLSRNVRHVFLIGEAAEPFSRSLNGRVAISVCGTLKSAFAEAQRLASAEARPEPVVLLSPACASYDQFRDFEHRGETFRAFVTALPGRREAA